MTIHVMRGKNFLFKIDDVESKISEYISPSKIVHVEYGVFEFLVKQLILEHVKNGVDITDPKYVNGIDSVIGKLKSDLGVSLV